MNIEEFFDNDSDEIQDLLSFSDAFNNESNHGAALIAASRVDEVLKGILKSFLLNGKPSDMLLDGMNAPLGTLSSRANAAHALGLIQDNELHEISIIRKIRNEFAHNWKGVSFNSEKIKSLCNELPEMSPLTRLEKSPKNRFSTAVYILLTDLLWRETLVKDQKVKQQAWPNKLRNGQP